MNSFLIVTTFRNAEDFIAQSARQSLRQRYDDYRSVFIDDASTDGSWAALQAAVRAESDTRCKEIVLTRHSQRRGSLQNTHRAILDNAHAGDIVVSVDGDDWLVHEHVLTMLSARYEQDGCWLLFGGAVWNPPDLRTYRSGPYTNDELAELRVPLREGGLAVRQRWKVQPIRSFRVELYQQIGSFDPEWSCLRGEKGQVYTSATDVAIWLPMMEMAGAERITHIRAGVYVYNIHDANVHRQRSGEQLKAARRIFASPSFPRIRSLDSDASSQLLAPCFVRPVRAAVGSGIHVSGWPYARRQLNQVRCCPSVVLDDFVEQTFCYEQQPVRHHRPWIGIFHHPPHVPEFSFLSHQLESIFKTQAWRDSMPHLLGAIALSEYLAAHLRRVLGIPVQAAKLPMARPARFWDKARFIARNPRVLVQVGSYLRNTRAIFQVTPRHDYARVRLLPDNDWVKDYDRRVRNYWHTQNVRTENVRAEIVRTEFDGVGELTSLPAECYEHLLSESVVLTEVFDASANNVVVECIVRNTPVIVNRHPAIVEYLGEDYPLYFDRIDEVERLLDGPQVMAAHEYLVAKDKREFDGTHFARTVATAIEKILAAKLLTQTSA